MPDGHNSTSAETPSHITSSSAHRLEWCCWRRWTEWAESLLQRQSHFSRCGASTGASRQHFSELIRSDREESELSMPAVWGSTTGHIWNSSNCAWQLISRHGFGRGLLLFWMTLVQLYIKSQFAADSPALWHLATPCEPTPAFYWRICCVT